MPDTLKCPDCGHPNPPGSAHCGTCNFPLAYEPLIAPPSAGPAPEPGTAAVPPIPRPPRRPGMRRPRPASNQALSLWLIFGAICAVAVVYVALRPNLQRSNPAIEGANESQRKIADGFRVALARDSTNVDAHIGLADILFDTANWPQAIEHYRAAIRRDSSRVQAIVDLGVSYYNTGDRRQAERLFHLALVRDPHQPVALFNLGIVSEGNMDYAGAMSYFHRALQSSPPDGMKQSILAAMERVQQAGGKTAPPFQGAR